MIAQEREFLKARANLDRLIEIVQQAVKQHMRFDEVGRSIFTELLSLDVDFTRQGFATWRGGEATFSENFPD